MSCLQRGERVLTGKGTMEPSRRVEAFCTEAGDAYLGDIWQIYQAVL